jgi:hypothetical protein
MTDFYVPELKIILKKEWLNMTKITPGIVGTGTA